MGANDIFITYKHIPVDAKFYAKSEFEVQKNFRPRISEKIQFKKFAWAYLKNFDFTESELKFEVI